MEKVLIGGVLLAFVAFLFPTLVTAITGVSGSELLKPLLNTVPLIFIACVLAGLYILYLRRES